MPSEWSNRALTRITVHPWTTYIRILCQNYTSQTPTTHLLSPNHERGASICWWFSGLCLKIGWTEASSLANLTHGLSVHISLFKKGTGFGDSWHHGYQISVWGKRQEKTGENDQNDESTKEHGEWDWKLKKKKNSWPKEKRNLRVGPVARTKREVEKNLQEDSEVL